MVTASASNAERTVFAANIAEPAYGNAAGN